MAGIDKSVLKNQAVRHEKRANKPQRGPAAENHLSGSPGTQRDGGIRRAVGCEDPGVPPDTVPAITMASPGWASEMAFSKAVPSAAGISRAWRRPTDTHKRERGRRRSIQGAGIKPCF